MQLDNWHSNVDGLKVLQLNIYLKHFNFKKVIYGTNRDHAPWYEMGFFFTDDLIDGVQ